MVLSPAEVIIRLGVALCLGSLLGLERQLRHRPAGLHTNSLVSLGAALFVMLAVLTDDESSPTRIAAQVVTGIGFLAGGVIIKEGASVRGLNTAATLWCSAAVGSMAGSGHIPEALAGTGLVFLANLLFRPVSRYLYRHPLHPYNIDVELCYRCHITCDSTVEMHIRAQIVQKLAGSPLGLRSVVSRVSPTGAVSLESEVIACRRDDAAIERFMRELSPEVGVVSTSWHISEYHYG